MDQLEAVTAPVVEREIDTSLATFGSRFGMNELLRLYDAGKSFLPKRYHERWRDTFSIGVSCGGIYAAHLEGETAMLAVFWPTENPVVEPDRGVPVPNPDGLYAYVCWMWNAIGPAGVIALKSHIKKTLPEAKYIAHHDQRRRVKSGFRSEAEKRRGDGRLIVKRLTVGRLDLADRLISERGGHGK